MLKAHLSGLSLTVKYKYDVDISDRVSSRLRELSALFNEGKISGSRESHVARWFAFRLRIPGLATLLHPFTDSCSGLAHVRLWHHS